MRKALRGYKKYWILAHERWKHVWAEAIGSVSAPLNEYSLCCILEMLDGVGVLLNTTSLQRLWLLNGQLASKRWFILSFSLLHCFLSLSDIARYSYRSVKGVTTDASTVKIGEYLSYIATVQNAHAHVATACSNSALHEHSRSLWTWTVRFSLSTRKELLW